MYVNPLIPNKRLYTQNNIWGDLIILHRTPDGIIQNWWDDCHSNESDYDIQLTWDLMSSQVSYYRAMADLAIEQTNTEKLKQRFLELKIRNMELKSGIEDSEFEA